MSTLALPPERLDGSAPRALLRLRAGASPWPCWTFTDNDRGLQITLGSDPHCDWQIASAGVEEQELQIFFTGQALLTRSLRPGRGARLNGARLGAGWARVPDGARLEIGLASIEVSLRALPVESGGHDARSRPTLQQSGWPELESSVRGRSAQFDDYERAHQQASAEKVAEPAGPATPELNVWTLEEPAEASFPTSDAALGPHIFEEQEPPAEPVLLRYAVYSSVLGLLYAVWVLLLERI